MKFCTILSSLLVSLLSARVYAEKYNVVALPSEYGGTTVGLVLDDGTPIAMNSSVNGMYWSVDAKKPSNEYYYVILNQSSIMSSEKMEFNFSRKWESGKSATLNQVFGRKYDKAGKLLKTIPRISTSLTTNKPAITIAPESIYDLPVNDKVKEYCSGYNYLFIQYDNDNFICQVRESKDATNAPTTFITSFNDECWEISEQLDEGIYIAKPIQNSDECLKKKENMVNYFFSYSANPTTTTRKPIITTTKILPTSSSSSPKVIYDLPISDLAKKYCGQGKVISVLYDYNGNFICEGFGDNVLSGCVYRFLLIHFI